MGRHSVVQGVVALTGRLMSDPAWRIWAPGVKPLGSVNSDVSCCRREGGFAALTLAENPGELASLQDHVSGRGLCGARARGPGDSARSEHPTLSHRHVLLLLGPGGGGHGASWK